VNMDRVREARRLSVRTCVDRLDIGPLIVNERDDLLDVARRASAQPGTRVIGVVDDDGRLVGVLPILRLVEDVIARVDPGALMSDIADIEDVARFSHAVEARTAGDAMLEPAATLPDAMVGEVFRVLRERHLSGMYVVDGERRPVGYMDLLELAVLYLDVLERGDVTGLEGAAPAERAEPGGPSGDWA
jgi:CBS domain-containing protein